MNGMLKSLWQYRGFVISSIRNEFVARFARSRLGILWSILHPLTQAAIFAFVLAEVLGARLPGVNSEAAYPIYLLSGLAAWGLFSEILNRSLTVFIEQAGMLKKISFPRLCLPMIVWGTALVNHVLLLVAMALIFVVLGHFPTLAWLSVLPGLVLISVFAFGLGMILGVFNIFMRDIGQAMAVVMQMWFWLTPIVYMREIIPEHLRWIVDINPMTACVRIYQDALLYGRWPELTSLIGPSIVALLLFAAAFVLFRRASAELVDAL